MKKFSILLAILATLLLIGCKLNKPSEPPASTPGQSPVTEPDTSTEAPKTPKNTEISIAPYFKNGDVTFSKPQQIEILSQEEKDEIVKVANKNVDPKYAVEWSSIKSLLSFYDVGKINNGIYKDQKLILFEQACEGPCSQGEINRFAYDEINHKLTMLKEHSAQENSSYVGVFTDKTDKTTELKGLTLPEKIKIPNSDKYIEIETRDVYLEMADNEHPQYNTGFEDSEFGTVNFSKLPTESGGMTFGCFFVKSPDGTLTKYRYNPGLIDEGGKDWINWTNGEKATSLSDNYVYNDSGCGYGGMCYTVESVDPNDLILVGKSTGGIELYESKDSQNIYETYPNWSNTEMPLDEYLKIHPVLFWKDPLDRWSVILNNIIKPPAECGKPVIYLYPQSEIDVNVKVGIDRLTETIPAYSSEGWTVHAYPDGSLYNYADNQTYPYLYWEGESDNQSSANQGFVVKRNELNDFFDRSLAKLGLNKTEITDFKDFWVSRMLDNKEPYFFISFIGTKDFNKIAPLSITPAPDSLLRVFMYYQPLKNFVNVPAQSLTAPERKGFSVVEWGGTSNVPWRK